MHAATLSFSPALLPRPAASSSDLTDAFLQLARRHQQRAFQITFGLLRDESAAETVTRQVFAGARRRLASGVDATSATLWVYHASLRFACRYYWKNTTPAMRRKLGDPQPGTPDDFDLGDFVRVLALHPGKIDPHDCELISLRHVLKLSLPQISQLVRMHPYEISNRLTWSRERVKEILGTLPSPRFMELQPEYA